MSSVLLYYLPADYISTAAMLSVLGCGLLFIMGARTKERAFGVEVKMAKIKERKDLTAPIAYLRVANICPAGLAVLGRLFPE